MGSAPGLGAGQVFLLALALALAPGLGAFAREATEGRRPAHFLYQELAECHFARASGASNGTEEPPPPPQVRYLDRYIYNRQEIARFDSALGRYEALSPVAQASVDRWNRDQALLQRLMANVEGFCRHNYGIFEPFALRRKIPPKLKITPTDYDSSSHNTLLICSVDSFFPAKIKIMWFRNGKQEDKLMTTDLIRNGDWTYGIHVMLETKPERGDVYTCQVEHASFPSPASVQWEPQSDSARSKMWTGIVGILLGVVFVAAGFSFYLRNKKGDAVPQATVGLMD